MAQHNKIATSLYKSKDKFENSIWDQGWDELVLGAACYSFEGDIDKTVVNVLPEDRKIAETNSMNKYVGDWRVVKPVWNVHL
jgi:pyruvate ferredoxin oxidoreductase delta subunit